MDNATAIHRQVVRESRLAAGTVVGITIYTDDPAAAHLAADAAYATVERWEALLSEWRPDSAVSRLNTTGGAVAFPPEGERLFALAEQLRIQSFGAFNLAWSGGTLTHTPAGWTVTGGHIGLGGILKGFLADRAAETLRAAGVPDFLVDAAGDVVAHGSEGGLGSGNAPGSGWRVEVVSEGALLATVRLRNEALSTSGEDQQPGHIRDPRTGAAVTCARTVAVVAPTGVLADGLATAIFAGCAGPALAEAFGASAVVVGVGGRRRYSRGARPRFRRTGGGGTPRVEGGRSELPCRSGPAVLPMGQRENAPFGYAPVLVSARLFRCRSIPLQLLYVTSVVPGSPATGVLVSNGRYVGPASK